MIVINEKFLFPRKYLKEFSILYQDLQSDIGNVPDLHFDFLEKYCQSDFDRLQISCEKQDYNDIDNIYLALDLNMPEIIVKILLKQDSFNFYRQALKPDIFGCVMQSSLSPYNYLEYCSGHSADKIPKEMLYMAYQQEKKRGFPSGKTLLIMKEHKIYPVASFHIVQSGYIPIKTDKQIVVIDETKLMTHKTPDQIKEYMYKIRKTGLEKEIIHDQFKAVVRNCPYLFTVIRDLSMHGRFRIYANFFDSEQSGMYEYVNNTIRYIPVDYYDGDLTLVPIDAVDHFYDYS